MKFTKAQLEAARECARQYEARIELIRQDVEFELAMRFDLTDEESEELFGEAL